MQTILVTGAGGYIGSHAVKKLLKDGFAVVALDNFSRGYREPLETLKKYGDLKVVEGDVSKKEDLREAFKTGEIDAVMHFAALCLVDESMHEPELYFRVNTEGTQNLLEIMQEFGVKNIIFSSTCAVYGESQSLPIDEKHPTNPVNPYGKSKLKAEKAIEELGNSDSTNYVILRYFNVCGADQDGEIGDSKKPSELLVQNAVRGALGIEEFKLTCPEVNTPDHTPIRDYIDVLDIVDAHIAALKYLQEGRPSEIFNLGNGRGWSVKEIVNAVKKELGVEFPIKKGEARKGEYAEVYADPRKAEEIIGWKPQRGLSESILSLKKWYGRKPGGYSK